MFYILQRLRFLLKPIKDRDNYIKATTSDIRMNGGTNVLVESV